MRTSFLSVLALAAACAQTPPGATSSSTAAQPTEPWVLEAVTPDTSDGIRILVLHDMEGLSGQSDPATFDFGTPQYPHGQELLAGDINAVVEGLFQGGATEVQVVDGHGSGNPDPDVRRELLDQRATQVLRDQPFDGYFDLVVPKAYDGVAVVGMHAKTGSRGFASHTLTLGIGLVINGKAITETELVGLSWGRQGIPVIFGSGDDRLAADLVGMSWLEFVTVKKATAADSAEPRPIAEARADLTARARRAVENLRAGRTRAMRVSLPLTAGLKAVPPASLAMLDGIPGIAYRDSVFSFPADSIRHAYDVIGRLVGLATTGYTATLRQTIRANPAGPQILEVFSNDLARVWFDYESQRWRPPAPAAPGSPGRKYHGYR
jgi:D-amino peptidase